MDARSAAEAAGDGDGGATVGTTGGVGGVGGVTDAAVAAVAVSSGAESELLQQRRASGKRTRTAEQRGFMRSA